MDQAAEAVPFHESCSWPTGEVEEVGFASCGFAAGVGEEVQGYIGAWYPWWAD